MHRALRKSSSLSAVLLVGAALGLGIAQPRVAEGHLRPPGRGGRDSHRMPSRAERVGCADGHREGFRSTRRYPDIAACAGGFQVPGVATDEPPRCERHAGDDGTSPTGVGCSVEDFCAEGWHVCVGPTEVAARSRDGCDGAHDAEGAFFATRASGPGCGVCATGAATDCGGNDCRADCAMNDSTTNDVFGCGTIGAVPEPTTCGVLDRFSHDQCTMLPAPWACADDGTGTHEARVVTKPGPEAGGVLCCRDLGPS